MPTENRNHPDDHDAIERLHQQYVGKVERLSDDLMVFQDTAYAMGLERGKRLEAARADELQQRLTAAEQRADTATSLVQRYVANFDTEIQYHEDIAPNDLEHDQVLKEMREFLGVFRPADAGGDPCAAIGCTDPRTPGTLFCEWHQSVRSRFATASPTNEQLAYMMQRDGEQQ